METVNLPEKAETIRVRVNPAYDGTDFRNWAAQPGLCTMQGEIETTLALIARMPPVLTVAGRTDTGVHAHRQVVHVDIPLDAWQVFALRGADREDDAAIGTALTRRPDALIAQAHGEWGRGHGLLIPRGSPDIVVSRISRVNADFDARFSALGRSYCYRICEGASDPLRRCDVLSASGPLNLEAMNRGAAALLDEHDFLPYCRPREGATMIRILRRLEFTRLGEIIEYRVEVDAFCHSMVRSPVGAHLPIDQGKKPESWSAQLLEKCSREGAAPIAPAYGLTLGDVHHPEEEQWTSRAETARRHRGCCQKD